MSSALDELAETAMALTAALRRGEAARFRETEPDLFEMAGTGAKLRFEAGALVADRPLRLRGRRIELLLSSRRFLFPSFAAPRKAADFLDAMVKSQIDRLTPWTRAQADFGFLAAPADGEQTRVTLAVAPRPALAPYVAAAEALGARSVAVYALREGGETPILVREAFARPEARLRRYRYALVATLAVAAVLAIGAAALDSAFENEAEAARATVVHEAALRRAQAAGLLAEPALAEAVRHKSEATPAVIVLEALSRALPDDAYLTQMRMTSGKLEIDGVARSASGLVPALDVTAPFQRVQFSAPTTPAATEGAEQFHIEADIAASGRNP